MKWKYLKDTKRLNVFGTDSDQDMNAVKKLIADKKIPADLNAIVYQKAKNSAVVMFIRGRYLENLLKVNDDDRVIAFAPRRGIKDILKQINDSNSRQATYSGLLLYAKSTKKFLFFTPRNRGNVVQLLGDHPNKNETPAETVCRVAKEDGDFEITPEVIVALMTLEIDGTTYHSYICLCEREFKPNLSSRVLSAVWKTYDEIKELELHPSVSALFDKDKKLQRLIKPLEVDFDKLIDEILHSA